MTERPRRRPQYEDDHIVLSDDDQVDVADNSSHHEHHPGMEHGMETRREYWKFAGLIAAIVVVSAIVTTIRGWDGNRFANDFMAVFFMTFAAFKFARIEEFAAVYRTYDILAKNFRPWPYMLPFIEAFLGIAYFISTDAWQINILTMLVTGIGAYGVWKELRKKSNIPCACLGTIIKLPLTKVSLAENLTMFAMATLMLFT